MSLDIRYLILSVKVKIIKTTSTKGQCLVLWCLIFRSLASKAEITALGLMLRLTIQCLEKSCTLEMIHNNQYVRKRTAKVSQQGTLRTYLCLKSCYLWNLGALHMVSGSTCLQMYILGIYNHKPSSGGNKMSSCILCLASIVLNIEYRSARGYKWGYNFSFC